MNTFTTFWARMNERSKLLLVGGLAFFLGGFFKGSSSPIGRYQACGNSPTYIIDTQKGTTWEIKGTEYQKLASLPW